MNCPTCGDKGVLRIWADSDEFALCLCTVGHDWRREYTGRRGTYALWQLWCSREQVPPSKLFLLEEVLTPEELAAAGFQNGAQEPPGSREIALLAAAKAKPRVRH